MLQKVDNLKEANDFIAFKINSGSYKIHPGRPSKLEEIRSGLSRSKFKPENKAFK